MDVAVAPGNNASLDETKDDDANPRACVSFVDDDPTSTIARVCVVDAASTSFKHAADPKPNRRRVDATVVTGTVVVAAALQARAHARLATSLPISPSASSSSTPPCGQSLKKKPNQTESSKSSSLGDARKGNCDDATDPPPPPSRTAHAIDDDVGH